MISGVLKIGTLELPWVDCEVLHRNALVRHEFPGVPGQVVESTGRGPYEISATVVLSENWTVVLDALLYAADVEQEGDLTLADGRVIHVAVDSVSEQWKQVDGISLRIVMIEDADADAYTVPSAPQLSRTAPEIARARGWSSAAAALEALRDELDAASPPTMGELVASYGAVSAALLDVEEVALEAADEAGLLDRSGAEGTMWAVTLRWAALGSLPGDARAVIHAAG